MTILFSHRWTYKIDWRWRRGKWRQFEPSTECRRCDVPVKAAGRHQTAQGEIHQLERRPTNRLPLGKPSGKKCSKARNWGAATTESNKRHFREGSMLLEYPTLYVAMKKTVVIPRHPSSISRTIFLQFPSPGPVLLQVLLSGPASSLSLRPMLPNFRRNRQAAPHLHSHLS